MQKVDANSDGTVSWDEFCSYMFLAQATDAAGESDEWEHHRYQFQDLYRCAPAERREREGGRARRLPTADRPIPPTSRQANGMDSLHRGAVTFLDFVEKQDRYITASVDGARALRSKRPPPLPPFPPSPPPPQARCACGTPARCAITRWSRLASTGSRAVPRCVPPTVWLWPARTTRSPFTTSQPRRRL